MKIEGCTMSEWKGLMVYQRVRHTAQKIVSNTLDCPVSASIAVIDADIIDLTVTLSTASTYTKKNNTSIALSISLSSTPFSERRKRRCSKEKQHHDTVKIYCDRFDSNTTKLATTRITVSCSLLHRHPDKRDDTAIVRSVNDSYQISISMKMVNMMVRDGRVGMWGCLQRVVVLVDICRPKFGVYSRECLYHSSN